MSNFSPGPWWTEEGKIYPSYSRSMFPLCKMSSLFPLHEQEANARLIVAAPELLAACEAALKDVETLGTVQDWTVGWIEAAVSKAKGDNQ